MHNFIPSWFHQFRKSILLLRFRVCVRATNDRIEKTEWEQAEVEKEQT